MQQLTTNKIRQYTTFISQYVSEGIQLSIATVIIPIYLIEKGYSVQIATLVSGLVMIPWTIKFFFGWLVDHFQKRGRKPFVIYGGIISSLSLFFLTFIDPTFSLILFQIILMIGHSGVSIIDVSIDSWAIETTTKSERGKLNGMMMSGLFLGLATGASTLSYVANEYGYPTTFLIGSIAIGALIILPILTPYQKQSKIRPDIPRILIKECKKNKTTLLLILLPLISINSGIITLAVPLFLKLHYTYTIASIGFATMIFTIGRILGSLLLGTLSDTYGRKQTLLMIIIATIIFTIMIPFSNEQSIIPLYATLGFLNGALFTILLAISMDITNKRIGATEFSLLISVMNIGELLGETSSGTLITTLGFSRMFLFAAWIMGPGLLIFLFFKDKQIKIKNKIKST